MLKISKFAIVVALMMGPVTVRADGIADAVECRAAEGNVKLPLIGGILGGFIGGMEGVFGNSDCSPQVPEHRSVAEGRIGAKSAKNAKHVPNRPLLRETGRSLQRG
jgi:hypothetical protein